MVQVEIRNGPAVGSKVSVKFPFPAQKIDHQRLGSAAWFPVGAVVRAHETLHPCIRQLLKSRQVGFFHILFTCNRIKFMPQRFRSGMHRKVLGAGSRF